MTLEASLTPADYAVAVIILLVPVFIGIWYAVKDANKATRAEYLLGGRQMSIIPVALSMFITFQSAISMIGQPAEIFYYGLIFAVSMVGLCSTYLIGYFTVVPVMYPLQITSIYEYLRLRYKSDVVHKVSTIVGIFTTTTYMAIALLSPALALQASANLPLWMSIAVFGAVGTIYTAIGGFKSVIWTDVFQTVIVYVGLLAIIIKASVEVGGLGEVWRLSQTGGITDFHRFTPDPRIRHTVWGLAIGVGTTWLVSAFNQSTMQRISSMKSLKDARIAFMLNVPLNVVFSSSLCLVGLAVFAYFSFHRCDPFKADFISNRNQLAPFFVLHAMTDMPGMAGLFVAVLCCGSLSTLSSGINALAANTVEDILSRPLRSFKEGTIIFFTKLIVVAYGALIIGLAFLATALDGPITQMASSAFGAFGSPIVAIFLMGGAVPWANKYGALAGAAVALTFNLWISIGTRVQGIAIKSLRSIGSEGCLEWAGISNSTTVLGASTTSIPYSTDAYVPQSTNAYVPQSTNAYVSQSTDAFLEENRGSANQSNDAFPLYTISYEYYSLLGITICLSVGLTVSYITNRFSTSAKTKLNHTYTEARFIFPFLRRFWGLEAVEGPSHFSNCEITVDEDQSTAMNGTDMHLKAVPT